VTVDDLIDGFRRASVAVRDAVGLLDHGGRRARTRRAGQYHLDVVADAAALAVLAELDVAVVSEESGRSGRTGAPVTVVLDPVDGSTNASRGISYWATSICALDGDGPLAAYVVNQATGEENVAVRGAGAWRDGTALVPSKIERLEDAVIALSGRPPDGLRWKQYRALGCAALTLCDVAAGGIDASVDSGPWHAPWDYLGGLLVCREAGALVLDPTGADLVTAETDARRQLVAAATRPLLDSILAVDVVR
jgi:fructose-1,6-bisphosphatase/inositol monophosphatase family enzyme